MKNTIKILLIVAMLSSGASFALAKDGALYTSSYKKSYKLYMDKGEDYFTKKQYKSAINAWERALIIKPDSNEAREKISLAYDALSGKKRTPYKKQAKREAMNEAVSYAEYSSRRAKTQEARVKEYPDVSVPEYKSAKSKPRPYIASNHRFQGRSLGFGWSLRLFHGPYPIDQAPTLARHQNVRPKAIDPSMRHNAQSAIAFQVDPLEDAMPQSSCLRRSAVRPRAPDQF